MTDELLTCSREQLRAIFGGISQTRLTQFLAEGMPKAVSRGVYDVVSCVRWYVDRKLRSHGQVQRRTQTDYYHEVAQLKNLERRRLEGELLDRTGVERFLGAVGQAVQDFAESVPPAVADELAELAEPHEIEARLDRELAAALNILADRIEAFELETGVSLEPTTAAPRHDPRVGEEAPQDPEGAAERRQVA